MTTIEERLDLIDALIARVAHRDSDPIFLVQEAIKQHLEVIRQSESSITKRRSKTKLSRLRDTLRRRLNLIELDLGCAQKESGEIHSSVCRTCLESIETLRAERNAVIEALSSRARLDAIDRNIDEAIRENGGES